MIEETRDTMKNDCGDTNYWFETSALKCVQLVGVKNRQIQFVVYSLEVFILNQVI
jgi:hypothetical protein